jgi:HEPN domain-containing protein
VNLERLARGQLARAEARLRIAERAFEEREWSDAIRFSQEAVELALKALLRSLAADVPKRHDVGPVLVELTAELPTPIRAELPTIVRLSKALADRRALALYGDELEGVPADEIFRSRDEAERFLRGARSVVARVAEALVRRPTQPSKPPRARRRPHRR